MRGPLTGVKVLDFGQYFAGPLTATLLGDLGADIVRVETPGGPRWDHPANTVLHRGRRETLSLDLNSATDLARARELIRETDVLVENFGPGVAERLRIGPNAACELNPRLVYCALPGFPSNDPRANLPGWEAVVMAAAGAYAAPAPNPLLGSGWWPGADPVWSPLPLASVFAAAQCALAAVAALVARDRDGTGQRVECSLFGGALEAMGARLVSYERRPSGGRPLGSGLYRCADGRSVSFIATRFEHLEWLIGKAGAASRFDEVADFERLGSDREARALLKDGLVALFASRTSDEWETLGREAGVPLACVRSLREWRREPHAAASGAADAVQLVRVTETAPATAVVDRTGDGALAGARVLDLTRVMAGPTATRLLAELGADVVKADVDPATRRIGYREPLFHEHMNRGKQSLRMDLGGQDGRALLRELLAWADVVAVNFSRPVVERLGLTSDDIQRRNPAAVVLYMNAFGNDGPWADRRGFAETVNVACGLTWRTLADDVPSGVAPQVDFPRSPFTDYLAGVLGALTAAAALLARHRTGRGQVAETSLLAAATCAQLPYVLDEDGAAQRALGRPGWRPLHRLFDASDGWLAVGGPEHGTASVADALGAVDATNGGLERAIAALGVAEASRRVASAGAAAQRVIPAEDVMAEGGSADLAGFRDVQVSPEFGTIVQPGQTILLERTPATTGRLPAPFGAEDDIVRARIRDVP